MIEVTVYVMKSDDMNEAESMYNFELPGVPRVGDTVVARGATFKVKDVSWAEGDTGVSIYVKSDTYGYHFPTVGGDQ